MSSAQFVQRLSDGQWHQIDDAVQCQAQLAAVGLDVETTADGRCRLSQAIELFDADLIRTAMTQTQRITVDVAGTVDSTNTQLLNRPMPDFGRGTALVAGFQNSGRGRQNRSWQSSFGGGICLSVAWQFRPAPKKPGTLSLAAGVAVLRALARLGVTGVKLKWPNDLLYGGRKLGGVLVDASQTGEAMHVVAGVGLNLHLSTRNIAEINASGGLQAAALGEINTTVARGRNALAAAVMDALVEMFSEFQQKGFDPFRQEWNHADVLNGCAIQVSGLTPPLAGEAVGVDESGALLVRAGETTHRLYAGDVRVRSV